MLGPYFRGLGAVGALKLLNKIHKLVKDKTFESTVAEVVGFNEFEQAIKRYEENMTKGKILLNANLE